MKIAMISDRFSTHTDTGGGAELVDYTIISQLKIETKILSSETDLPNDHVFILTNFYGLSVQLYDKLCSGKYPFIIIEHDYKFFPTRNPWSYKDSICPEGDKRFLQLYKAAKTIYLQSDDQLNVFKSNGIPGKFYSFECSIWSQIELEHLDELWYSSKHTVSDTAFYIVNSTNPIKGTEIAVNWCKSIRARYKLSVETNWFALTQEMSRFSTLIFFPLARESLCRLVIEAKCLGLNVITTHKPYGANTAEFYDLSPQELIDYLALRSQSNLDELRNICHLMHLQLQQSSTSIVDPNTSKTN